MFTVGGAIGALPKSRWWRQPIERQPATSEMIGRALLREPPLADAARVDLLRARGLLGARQLLRAPLGDVALAADLSARSAAVGGRRFLDLKSADFAAAGAAGEALGALGAGQEIGSVFYYGGFGLKGCWLMAGGEQALDMFVQSANRPLFLRSGLAEIDRALHGGLRVGGITEVVLFAADLWCVDD